LEGVVSEYTLGDWTLDGRLHKTFLTHTIPIFAHATTKPHSFSLMDSLRSREGEKIEGQRKFKFCFKFPERWTNKGEGGQKEYPLPASFLEHGARVAITYQLTTRVRRGKLAMDSECVTFFLPVAASFLPQPLRGLD
jgi:hypothetical protein